MFTCGDLTYSVWPKHVFSKDTQCLVVLMQCLNMRDCLKCNKLVCFQTKTNLRQRTLHFKLHYGLILVQDYSVTDKRESVNC